MKISVILEALTGTFVTDMQKATKKAESSLHGLKHAASHVAREIAAELGVALSVGAVVVGIERTIHSFEEMARSAQKIGVAVDALSELHYAASLTDVPVEVLDKGLAKLSKTMLDAAQGGKKQAELFRLLGVDVKNTDGTLRSTVDVFEDISDVFAHMEDGSTKTALSIALLGRAGNQLIPIMDEGKRGLEEFRKEAKTFGVVLDEKTGKAAEEFNDNLKRLQFAVKGVFYTMAKEALPTLVDFTKAVVDLAKDKDFRDGISSTLQFIADAAITGARALEQFGNALSFVKGAGRDFVTAAEGVVFGIEATNATALESKLEEAKKLLKLREAQPAFKLGITFEADEARAEVAKWQQAVDRAYQLINARNKRAAVLRLRVQNEKGKDGKGDGKDDGDAEKAKAEEEKRRIFIENLGKQKSQHAADAAAIQRAAEDALTNVKSIGDQVDLAYQRGLLGEQGVLDRKAALAQQEIDIEVAKQNKLLALAKSNPDAEAGRKEAEDAQKELAKLRADKQSAATKAQIEDVQLARQQAEERTKIDVAATRQQVENERKAATSIAQIQADALRQKQALLQAYSKEFFAEHELEIQRLIADGAKGAEQLKAIMSTFDAGVAQINSDEADNLLKTVEDRISRVQDKQAALEQAAANRVAIGSEAPATARQEVLKGTDEAIAQLTELRDVLAQLAKEQIPGAQEALEKLDNDIGTMAAQHVTGLRKVFIDLQAELDDLQQSMPKDIVLSFRDNFAEALASIADGSKSAKEAFKDMARSFLNDMAQIIAKAIATQIALKLLSTLGIGGVGSAGGGLLGGALGGLFGRGAAAAGGNMLAGTGASLPLFLDTGGNVATGDAAVVGEKRAEFVGAAGDIAALRGARQDAGKALAALPNVRLVAGGPVVLPGPLHVLGGQQTAQLLRDAANDARGVGAPVLAARDGRVTAAYAQRATNAPQPRSTIAATTVAGTMAAQRAQSDAQAAEALSRRLQAYRNTGHIRSALASAYIGARDFGSTIPAGKVALVGERRPELVSGPATVTGGAQTSSLIGRMQERASAPPVVRVINAFDDTHLEHWFASPAGERVFLNHASRNGRKMRTYGE